MTLWNPALQIYWGPNQNTEISYSQPVGWDNFTFLSIPQIVRFNFWDDEYDTEGDCEGGDECFEEVFSVFCGVTDFNGPWEFAWSIFIPGADPPYNGPPCDDSPADLVYTPASDSVDIPTCQDDPACNGQFEITKNCHCKDVWGVYNCEEP